jgi:dephospho-CoA kinase
VRYNIGVIGKLGSGKTSAANFLIDNYGYTRLSLADPIKEIMKEYLDIKDKRDPRYRKTAQMIGTDWFRSVDPLVWVKYLLKRAFRAKDRKIICDDVRFENEANSLLNNNWLLLYLDCPLEVRKQRCINRDGVFDDATVNHPSETGVDDIIKRFGANLNLITIDASSSMFEMFDFIEFELEKREIYKLPRIIRWFKKGDWINWLTKVGPTGPTITRQG